MKNALLFMAGACFAISCSTPSSSETYPKEKFKEKFVPADYLSLKNQVKTFDLNAKDRVWAQKKHLETLRTGEFEWEFAGPVNIGGRITDIEMPIDDQQTIYAAVASGGVFKSDDLGNSWTALFDEQTTLSIGDIDVSENNTNLLYVGSGEPNAGGGSITYDGDGVFKSEDGGATWENKGLRNVGSIGKVLIHPGDDEIVFVAAMGDLFADGNNRGVFRTKDGGESWEQVLFVNDSTGFVDMACSRTGDTLYAAAWERVRRPERRSYGGESCGIYRSVDGGDNWTLLTNGLPQTDLGRIGICYSPVQDGLLYAIYADEIGYFKGIYKSEDAGTTWDLETSSGVQYQSYGWWFSRIMTASDPDEVYAMGFYLHRSSNGGRTFSNVTDNMHVDMHSLFIHPKNDRLVICGNDGGVYVSTNGGNDFVHRENMPITQYYACEIHPDNSDRYFGGAQDNGSSGGYFDEPGDWNQFAGGDGFTVTVNPNNPSRVEWIIQYGGSTSFGAPSQNDRSNWNTPYLFDPNDSDVMYYGTEYVYKEVNNRWSKISPNLTEYDAPNGNGLAQVIFGTITTIDVAKGNSDVIYAGTDNGRVWVTTNGGDNWTKVSGELPENWVTRVVIHPLYPEVAYLCYSGYRNNSYVPHVFKTEDYGATWEDITSNLPEGPVNDLIIDPMNDQHLMVASDVGVFHSLNDGGQWQAFGEGLPNVAVNDLDFHPGDRILLAATFGRSMYRMYIDSTVGEQDQDLVAQMGLYPNRVENMTQLKVSFADFSSARIEIYDMMGKKLKDLGTFSFNNSSNVTLNFSDLSAGKYILKVDDGLKFESLRFVKI